MGSEDTHLVASCGALCLAGQQLDIRKYIAVKAMIQKCATGTAAKSCACRSYLVDNILGSSTDPTNCQQPE